jgi:hypothetical protein
VYLPKQEKEAQLPLYNHSLPSIFVVEIKQQYHLSKKTSFLSNHPSFTSNILQKPTGIAVATIIQNHRSLV